MALSHTMAEAGAGIFARSGQLYSGGPGEGALQRLHPASRLVGLIFLVFSVALIESPLGFATAFAATVLAALVSYLDITSIFRVMLVPVALFAVPAWIVSAIVYDDGIGAAGAFFCRTVASVTVGVTMLHSIGLRYMGRAFSSLRVPKELRMMWSIMVSQVVGFSELLAEMAFARQARKIEGAKGRQTRAQVGRQAGVLFARMHIRSGQLGMAMESRNAGEIPNAYVAIPSNERWRGADWAFVAACAGLAITAGLS